MRLATRALALAAVLSVSLVAEGGEPPDIDTWLLPGRAAGTIQSRWVAPYVQETAVRVGDGWVTDVRWFRPDGSVRRETHGNGGAESAEDGVVHGLRDTWSVRLPQLPLSSDSTILRGEDDSTFVHSWVEGESIRANVYKEGKLISSVGPYPRKREFVLAEDGSMAVLTLKEPGSASVRVVVFAPEGKPSFEADAGGDAWIVSVAPGGLGVVLKGNAKNELTWISKKGTSRTLKIEPNPDLWAWVPGTTREVVTYGLAGKSPRFRLVDWESGETVWDIADPAEHICSRLGGIAIEGDLVLLAGIEDIAHTWCRTAQALDLTTGSLVARWSGGGFGEPGLPPPRFMRLDGKLWLVADDAFALFPVEDVRKKTGRWECRDFRGVRGLPPDPLCFSTWTAFRCGRARSPP
jgi:hypothetical protein